MSNSISEKYNQLLESKGLPKTYIGDVKIKIAKLITESSIDKKDKVLMIKSLRESNDSAIYNFLAFGCLKEIKNERVLNRAKRLSKQKIVELRQTKI